MFKKYCMYARYRKYVSSRTILQSFFARNMTSLQQFTKPLYLLQGRCVCNGLSNFATFVGRGQRFIHRHTRRLCLHLFSYLACHLLPTLAPKVFRRRLTFRLLDFSKVKQSELRKSIDYVLSILWLGGHRVLKQTQVCKILQWYQRLQVAQFLYHVACQHQSLQVWYAMLQPFANSDNAIVIEKQGFYPFQKWKSIQLSYVVIGKVYRIELILCKNVKIKINVTNSNSKINVMY